MPALPLGPGAALGFVVVLRGGEDFARPGHRVIYDAIVELYDKVGAVDVVAPGRCRPAPALLLRLLVLRLLILRLRCHDNDPIGCSSCTRCSLHRPLRNPREPSGRS